MIETINKTRFDELKAAMRESDVRLARGLELEQILARIDLHDDEPSIWDRIRTAPPEEEQP